MPTILNNGFGFVVIGGIRPEKNNLAKFIVSLRFADEANFGFRHTCCGSIISNKLILTAAHCVVQRNFKSINHPSAMKIVAGTPRRLLRTNHTQEVKVDEIKVHPHYQTTFGLIIKNDIALIKLKDELDINDDFTNIIPLADQKPKVGQRCTIIGWGTILEFGPLPDEIVSADAVIISDAHCAKFGGYHKDVKLCISNSKNYETKVCHGDSGGPLICDNKVVGITSYGVRCGFPTVPDVYTNVYYFREWISRNSVCCLTNNVYMCYKLVLITLALFTAICNQ
ncbi:hypothetical protein KR093_008199 [Drosophila rubida]|uniref:trypsin n=1 Tax=Drosophila rubida TaxID=30044 RepID=A0AAD4JUR5_9MUSC|nr:hypothetical protein KR093_008199 [Drosophila rubida]